MHWLRMLFVWRGSVLPKILPQLLLITLLAVLVTCFHGHLFRWKVTLTFAPFTLMGLALAIFLGFRNSASYARYWEARNLWGELLIESRSLARQALTLQADPVRAREFINLICAFTYAVKHQLRHSDPAQDLRRLLPAEHARRVLDARFRPPMVLTMAGEWMRDARRRGELTDILSATMEPALGALSRVLGGCERLASTPIPFTYSVIIHRTVYCYCFLLPFGLVDAIGFMSPVIVAFIAYTFFALEALSNELEHPFNREQNALALDALSRLIEVTLRDMAGEHDLPPLLQPEHGQLL